MLLSVIGGLATVVPMVAKWLGGSKAEEAAEKIAGIAKVVTGLDNPKEAVKAILEDPNARLKFMESIEEHRFDLDRIYLADRQDAREMYGKHNAQADSIAHRITMWNVPYILAMVILNCLVVYYIQDNAALIAIASNIIGIVIKSLLDQMQSVTGFYFGSSLGSKAKG